MGTKATKSQKQISGETDLTEALFKTFSNGVKTNRDTWAYNFDPAELQQNVQALIQVYNHHVVAWQLERESLSGDLPASALKRRLDEFVDNDPTKISWSESLKSNALRGRRIEYAKVKIRNSIYRPFCRSELYFDTDRVITERVYGFPSYFPTIESEAENRVICVPGIGGRSSFWCFITALIPELHLTSIDAQQCFPFYTYNEDGSGRRENVTDWALARYRERYGKAVSKWDIFHYCYGLLHHPEYRERYAANLRKSLPHIPEVAEKKAFRRFAEAGEALAELHVNYEQQPKHAGLREVRQEGKAPNLRVEKMRLSKDKRSIVYNDSLVIDGIPPETFDYRLGSRSALEWVIDQYRVKTDKASGIVNDPNRQDDPGYIVKLIGQVVTVSLETRRIVNGLPPLDIAPPE
ncbi:MAG: helicase [SAR324 cluster bacterium]|nr:helicase [SAR324 cluster bacterium]